MQLQKISTLPSTEGIGISWGVGHLLDQQNKEIYELNWNFQRSGEGDRVLEKIPTAGVIFSGTTQCKSTKQYF